jgi:hypothetical protein
MHYFKNHQIDKAKWDNAIQGIEGAPVYALSFYLDAVTGKKWSAYINNDYSALIPVYYRNLPGIKRIIQPPFTQQLGLFTNRQDIHSGAIFKKLISRVPVVSYQTQKHPKLNGESNCRVNERVTFTLNLNQPFEEIKKQFSSNTKRNINKARKFPQTLRTVSIDRFMQLIARERTRLGIPQKHLKRLKKLLEALEKRNSLLINGIDNNQNIIAAGAWIITPNRIYYLAGASTEEGFHKRSMFLLQNHVIELFSNTNAVYDFEGSMIPGIARFFASFGAQPEVYYYTEKNTLPTFGNTNR